GEIEALHLNKEAAAFAVIAREVDLGRLPEEARQEFEDGRAEAWPRPVRAPDGFDRVAGGNSLDGRSRDGPAIPPRGESLRESDDQRHERQMGIIWHGAYFPEGWEAPHLTSPPASSVPGAVDRAKAQVEALKSAELSSMTPPETRAWDELPEWSKFNTL